MKNGISVLSEKGETQALKFKASFDKATIESLVAPIEFVSFEHTEERFEQDWIALKDSK